MAKIKALPIHEEAKPLAQPKKAMKYIILHAKHPSDLSENVSAHLEDGWELLGQPFVGCLKQAYEGQGGSIIRDLLMQALIKNS